METKILATTESDLEQAAAIIAAGGLVAFPTETVYGLGADALNAEAVASVYAAKGRPSDNPMIVHISAIDELSRLTVEVSEDMKLLAGELWPGPLTMVMKKSAAVPLRTTGGLDTVAVRMPDNRTALELIRRSGCAIAAPSANISGRPSPTRAKDVIQDMDGRIDAIVEGEDCRVGIESTVVDMTGDTPVILRPGIITPHRIAEILKKDVVYDEFLLAGGAAAGGADKNMRPKAPGMKYKHYAPKAEMVIVEGEDEKVRAELLRLQAQKESCGMKTGLIMFGERDFAEAAHDFFARLRDLDNEGVDIIIAGALSESDEVGFAVMNRMLKSAGYNIVKV